MTEEERKERKREWGKKYREKNKEKIKARGEKYREKNKEEIKARGEKYREKNKEKLKAKEKKYYEENKKYVLTRSRKYYEEHKKAYYANNAKRKAQKIKATPKWFEQERDKVVLIYAKAREFGFHVDHIVPLRSKKVCGLHTWANLQLLDKTLNAHKNNHYWPDMP
tara:strand:+ start:442 stop:939 length:498 start_codon:yes stop_codon:yes gene_type:complete